MDKIVSKTTQNPLVSVVITTHNRCGLLKEAIESVREQIYPSWELIIVDDASRDETISFLQTVHDANITKIHLDKNIGSSRARNVGLKRVRGKFVLFLDDDDLLPEDALAVHVKNLQKYRSVIASIGSRVRFHASGGRQLIRLIRKVTSRNIFWDVLFGWIAYTGQCFFSTEILRNINGWADEYTVGEGEDQELLLRLSRQGLILLIPDEVLLSRVHDGHLRRRDFQKLESQWMSWVRVRAVRQLSGKDYKRGSRYLEARNCFKLACRYYEEGDAGKAFLFYFRTLQLAPSIIYSPLIRRSVLSPMIKCLGQQTGLVRHKLVPSDRAIQEKSAISSVKYVD